MVKVEQVTNITDPSQYDSLVELVKSFITGAGETIGLDAALIQIFANSPSRLWFIYEDEILKGYLFAEYSKCIEGDFIAIHQLYMDEIKDRKIYSHIFNVLQDFSHQFGAKKLICSTRHNPRAFIRLIKHNFKIDSYILSSVL